MRIIAITSALLFLAGCAADEKEPFEEFRGSEAAREEAVLTWAGKGEAAIPELKKGLADDSSNVKLGCRRALALITGQWGWDDGLMWERDIETAKKAGKPIMVLQLFGKFDEEFC